MTSKIEFKKSFGSVLTSSGFVRKGQNWYLQGPDCSIVLNLQKNDFSDYYHVNFGIWILALGQDNPYPQEHHCHVRARLERIFPAQRELILTACTINEETPDFPIFIEFLARDVVPLSNRCKTLGGLRHEVQDGRIPDYAVIRIARPLLHLEERT